jgi:hypothetical protein
MSGANGTTTLDYNSNITVESPGSALTQSGAVIQMINAQGSTAIYPGGIYFYEGSIYGSSPVKYTQYIYNNQWNFYVEGLSEFTWRNYYVNPAPPYNYPTARVWTPLGDDFRPLGITPYGGQYLGARMFSGTATSSSTINTDINSRGVAAQSLNGDFYFSTA